MNCLLSSVLQQHLCHKSSSTLLQLQRNRYSGLLQLQLYCNCCSMLLQLQCNIWSPLLELQLRCNHCSTCCFCKTCIPACCYNYSSISTLAGRCCSYNASVTVRYSSCSLSKTVAAAAVQLLQCIAAVATQPLEHCSCNASIYSALLQQLELNRCRALLQLLHSNCCRALVQFQHKHCSALQVQKSAVMQKFHCIIPIKSVWVTLYCGLSLNCWNILYLLFQPFLLLTQPNTNRSKKLWSVHSRDWKLPLTGVLFPTTFNWTVENANFLPTLEGHKSKLGRKYLTCPP